MDIKSFIDIMNNKAIILDADFKIKLFNREWEDYLEINFDKSFEEMIGQNYLSEFNNLGLLSHNKVREIKSKLESLTIGDLNKFSVECLHNISKNSQKE
ncbi:hypothetical protein DFR79_1259 [Halanaerobium saccharolyticum]|uniref:PAS domain-containing protein n=1 Tax=Halanaerobium saccharolyticum TaxID=43595 RepID=A0A4R6LHK9_9FIRM|nr:hypothetical protein [Halanaerobium saccharolyticum]TDO83385.1 hypothetical protein DFR79_1259 [Halanaerobium saccharolyticum]